jgi:hypothetical protein
LRRFQELHDTLKDVREDLKELYEAWVLLDRYGGVYYCIFVSELPPGLKPGEGINRQVECDAYFFKRLEYETREKETGGGQVKRLAPLLIGRTILPRTEPADGSSLWAVPGAVLLGTFGLIGLSLGVGVAVVWWFRREDRRVRARLRQSRPQALPDGSGGATPGPFPFEDLSDNG